MSPLSLIPAPYRLLASCAAVALLLGVTYAAGHRSGAHGVQTDWDAEKAQQSREALRIAVANRAIERAWAEKLQGAVDDRTKLEIDLAAARAAAATATDRLRVAAGDFQRRLSEATAEACRTAAGAAAELLGQCGERYRQVAAAADGHLADLRQCESAWPE